ncbi:MAG: apolipoprotein N-acyltransferase, partial [Gemmatimonadales bacterium]|nr:apolipoprotein N-acyltransferase [Gemmatimonadales bacterium]NIN48702.1 apolipoprotein N-acyltransferase [Gemmatimonadales bacterium]NIP06166.1 apolipoprotein N-acyltransferase [Gemmatimonadales bacterium]
MALSPFALFHQAVPYALAIFYAPFMLPFAILLRRIYLRYRWPLTVLVPLVWVGGEWIRLRFSIGQVAMFPLGTAHFEQLTLIQIADLTGVAGVSFTVACGSGALADVVLRGGTGGWRRALPLGGFAALLAIVLLYGTLRGSGRNLVDGPRLALIQPNVTHYRDPERAKTTFAEQLDLTRDKVAPGAADLIVLPENTISVPLGDDPGYAADLGALAREQGARLVVGAFTRASLMPPRLYTSAYYLSEQGDLVARYHKLHLIPWAEYMPFQEWLPRLSPVLDRAHHALTMRLLGYVSTGVPGTDLVLFPIESEGR